MSELGVLVSIFAVAVTTVEGGRRRRCAVGGEDVDQAIGQSVEIVNDGLE